MDVHVFEASMISEQRQVIEDHIGSLRYFWEEKGDLERYASWPEVRDKLGTAHPLVKAWNDHLEAQARITLILKGMEP